jgi:DNA-binding GntR family transcriptional regulator
MGAVREALKRLEAEGLISLLPQRGVQITDINVRFINEAFQFRLLIEQDAARRMARAPQMSYLEALRERTEDLRDRAFSSIEADSTLLAEGLEVDLDLHVALVGNFNNTLITDTYQTIEDRVRLIRLNGTYDIGRLAVAMDEHLGIISALLTGNEDASAQAIKTHLTTSWRRALGDGEVGL